jgi:hypothetical protein
MTSPLTAAASPSPRKRRRRAFSLNGLAIQLSAFALSFTLVALLVVSGSQAAFVEENEIVTNHVPLGLPAQGGGGGDGGTGHPGPAQAAPPSATTPPAPSAPTTVLPAVEETTEPPAPDPVVELTDTDAGTALFTDGTVLAPGTTHSRCIDVTYVGEVDPAPVLLYAADVSGELAQYLDLVVEMGPAIEDVFGACAGFVPSAVLYQGSLAAFAAEHPAYDSGVPTWDPAEGDGTRSFRFSLSVRDEPEAEGKATSFGFSWETRAS